MEDQDDRREAALKRLKAKRDFRTHIAVYVIVNLMLVAIWAFTGRGYFWPIWALLGWGVGLSLNAWVVFFERPISEDDIRKEMERDGPVR